MSEILKDFPEDDYHANAGSDIPLFSYSVAKTIVQKSAYHAWLEHPLLGGKEKQQSPSMDRGNIIHDLLLGGDLKVEIIQAENYRTNAAKEQRDRAYAEGKTPILEFEYENVIKIVKIAKVQIMEYAPYFFKDHESELTVRWDFQGVKTQSRFDWINPNGGRIIDLKTTSQSISPDGLQRKIQDMGYDIQAALYTECSNQTWPDMAGRFDFEFIFIETEDPYLVSVVSLDGSYMWLGEAKGNRAAGIWSDCLSSGKWPAYGRYTVDAPAWAVNKEELIT